MKLRKAPVGVDIAARQECQQPAHLLLQLPWLAAGQRLQLLVARLPYCWRQAALTLRVPLHLSSLAAAQQQLLQRRKLQRLSTAAASSCRDSQLLLLAPSACSSHRQIHLHPGFHNNPESDEHGTISCSRCHEAARCSWDLTCCGSCAVHPNTVDAVLLLRRLMLLLPASFAAAGGAVAKAAVAPAACVSPAL